VVVVAVAERAVLLEDLAAEEEAVARRNKPVLDADTGGFSTQSE
jgi:hypothetical protein